MIKILYFILTIVVIVQAYLIGIGIEELQQNHILTGVFLVVINFIGIIININTLTKKH